MRISRREFNKAGLGAMTLAAFSGGTALAGQDELIKKAIPSTGELLPIIGLGTNRYGVGDDAEKRAVLRAALARFHELGGTVIDTAPSYRSSESVLGDLISDLGIRDDLFIATKADKDGGADATTAQMSDSQRKLKTETFDLMQVHSLRGWQDALPVMREWKQDGRIRYVGITTSRARQYEEFEKVMRQEELDFIQINYSLGEREAEQRLLPLAQEMGVAVLINRPFQSGRLFRAVGGKELPDFAREFAESWGQFFLKFIISHPAVTCAIPATSKPHHMADNLGAGFGKMPDSAMRQRMVDYFDSL